MLTIHPQYIKDAQGNKTMVVISAKEFDALMEELEDLEDVRIYDEAKAQDNGERIPMDEAFKAIENKRKNQQ
ncbi:MAG TPA: hypothetical protein VEB42_11585 [Chitinophagaceae bacterium]|nr:hypothetical protein [Chitinophagaceae bacterium]